MRLPHLDQLIPLARGEAGLLAQALAGLLADAERQLCAIGYQAGPPLTRQQVLTQQPLASLGRRLLARHRQEQLRLPRSGAGRAPARLLRVRYDELVAVLASRAALGHVNLGLTENLQLQRVLGEFQRASLNLTGYIRFGD